MSAGKRNRETPQRWEHRRIWTTSQTFEEHADLLGAEGWELVAVLPQRGTLVIDGVGASCEGVACYFRRQAALKERTPATVATGVVR